MFICTLLFLMQVMDADRVSDIIGLAIVNATNGTVESPSGFWQYRNRNNGSYTEWTNITVQTCYTYIYLFRCSVFYKHVTHATN